MQTPAEGLNRILETLDRLEIHYMVVGSAASSIHGIARPTLDVDLVADLHIDQIDDFAEGLKADFYADPEMMRQAILRGRCFNLIQYATSFKFDIFPLAKDEYSRIQFGRRQFSETKSLGPPVECAVASAEDTILNKLHWYRLGGETSERQWNDLRGIIRIQGDTLDRAYMSTWAPQLGVADLLDRLLRGE
ncbi:MAG TPA: hypothetical protein VKT81_28370 [Bryobacteraceae bacterium]|nr:hypothetical protein [Bryobacteraceae bacterium]